MAALYLNYSVSPQSLPPRLSASIRASPPLTPSPQHSLPCTHPPATMPSDHASRIEYSEKYSDDTYEYR